MTALIALVPTIIRLAQVWRGRGTPEILPPVEAVVGVFRVLLALAILAVAAGWRPLRGDAALPPMDAVAGAWSPRGFAWTELVFDLCVYALIYGLLHLALDATSTALAPRLGGDAPTWAGMVLFGVKNALVIPIATVHVLRALRLLPT